MFKLRTFSLSQVVLVLVICLTASSSNWSQSSSSSVDSLKSLVDNHPSEDSVWIDLMYEYIYEKQFTLDSTDYVLIEYAAGVAKDIEYQLGEARMIKYLGWYDLQHSNHKKALNSFYKSETLFNEKTNFIEYADVGVCIANTYLTMQYYEQALESYLKLVTLYDTIADSPGKARPYFYAAKCYGIMKDYENAEKFYIKAKSIAININFEMGISLANASLGETYLSQHKYEKALPFILESKELISTENETLNSAGVYLSLGSCYLGLKEFDKAKDNLLKSKFIFFDLGNYAQLKLIYIQLSKVAQYENKPEEANLYIDSAFAASDSIYSTNQLKEVENLKAKYETKKLIQEKELAQSNADLSEANEKTANVEAEKSKFQSLIAIAVALLVVIFLWVIFNRLKVIRSKNEELDIAYEKLEETKKHELAASNLKAIKSQMNPHFIFNAVNSIQDLVLQQETIKSYDYLVLFAQMVRTILDHSEREFIPLSEEVAFLNKYLGLEKLRFEEDFNYEIITDDCPQGIFIPSLIVQPFAENAIKHGLLHKDGPKKLTIRFEYTDELICFVEDNGVGEKEAKEIQGNKSSQHKSFSTDAISKRLALLQDQTNSEAKYVSSTIYKDTEVMGTLVEITLPIKS